MSYRLGIHVEMMFKKTPAPELFSAINGYGSSRIPAYHNSGGGGSGYAR
jgi:hypothetical protein